MRGELWQRVSMRVATYAITQLSVLIDMSQVLGLPLLIYWVVERQFALIAFAFTARSAWQLSLQRQTSSHDSSRNGPG
ncbi:hypothetical protein GCM10009720_06680 [Yaniella flava]|uniref:Uncharacterized protein n=1 Tax=Yaniella flava TaxID=287930 RepID=A0ABP5FPY7_9MICC